MRAGDEVTFLWRGHVVSGTVTSYSPLIDMVFIKSPEVEHDQVAVWRESVLVTEEEVDN